MTEIAAHRGGALLWTENSPTAFKNAMRLPIEQIEFDVHMSKDGVPVIHHDATLDRTTTGTGPVADHTLAELKTLTLKGTNGERIMTLEEGLRLLAPSPLKLRCEIKPGLGMRRYPGLEVKVIEDFARVRLTHRAILTSFNLETLIAVIAYREPIAGVIWLVSAEVFGSLGLSRTSAVAGASGVHSLGLPIRTVNREHVRILRATNFSVGFWGAHDEASIHKAFALDGDVFTTDRPDLALQKRAMRAG